MSRRHGICFRGYVCVEDGLYNDYRGYDIMIHEVGAFSWKGIVLFFICCNELFTLRVLLFSFPSSLGCSV